MTLDNVKCNVSNCRYWEQEHCTASAIEVNVDDGGNQADRFEKTNCQTFENQ